MKESLLILAAALAMVSCGGNAQQKAATAGTQQTTAAAPDMHNAETSLDYLGSLELAHKPNEFVPYEDVCRVQKVLTKLAENVLFG